MAEKKNMKSVDFWKAVAEQTAAFEAGTDEVSAFLATLSEVKDEPTHEV